MYGNVNSWTNEWMDAAESTLSSFLLENDLAFPGKIFGVWLCSGQSGEWNYAITANYKYFPDYNKQFQHEFCVDQDNKQKALKRADTSGQTSSRAASQQAACTAPSVMDRDNATLGNLYLTTDHGQQRQAIAFNTYMNERTVEAIRRLSMAAKHVSGGALWVGTFGGYLYNSANCAPYSGELLVQELLEISTIDGIGTPSLYFNASQDAYWGAQNPQGPWDTARLHGKMWVLENDQRTFFSDNVDKLWGFCHTFEATITKLRRNTLIAAMHGVGQYLFDISGTHYSNASQPEATAALWKALGQIRAEAEAIIVPDASQQLSQVRARSENERGAGSGERNGAAANATPHIAPQGLGAEVAVFTDDVSTVHWTVSTGTCTYWGLFLTQSALCHFPKKLELSMTPFLCSYYMYAGHIQAHTAALRMRIQCQACTGQRGTHSAGIRTYW